MSTKVGARHPVSLFDHLCFLVPSALFFFKRFCSPVFCFHFMFLCLLFSVFRLLHFHHPHPFPHCKKNNPASLPLHPTTIHTHHRNNTDPNKFPLITMHPQKTQKQNKTHGRLVPSAPPQDITCTSPSSTSILVSWAPPPVEFQNGVITGYSIQYSSTEGSKESKRIDGIPAENSQYLLEGLDKWTEYGLTVRAQTEAGDGPESLQLLIRTEEDGMFPKNQPPPPPNLPPAFRRVRLH